MNIDALSVVSQGQAQAQQQQQTQQMTEVINQQQQDAKTEVEVPIEASRPVESSINGNMLRFRVVDEDVEAMILNPKGELVKTIPPSDLQQIMKENAIPSLGNMINTTV